MKAILHHGSCPTWATADWDTCNCYNSAAWRIRKEPGELFPWRIWRRTEDFTYEHLMRCSSWAGAMNLVEQFIWLRNNVMERESNA